MFEQLEENTVSFKVKCILISRSFTLQKKTQTNCLMYRRHVFHHDSQYRMTFYTFHRFDTQFPGNHRKQEDVLINCCDTSNDLLHKHF